MPWLDLFEMIAKVFGPLVDAWIEDCLSPEKRLEAVRDFGPGVQAVVQRATFRKLLDAGVPRRAARQMARDEVATWKTRAETLSDAELSLALSLFDDKD